MVTDTCSKAIQPVPGPSGINFMDPLSGNDADGEIDAKTDGECPRLGCVGGRYVSRRGIIAMFDFRSVA